MLVQFDFRRGYRELEGRCPYKAAGIPARIAPTGLVERLECGSIEPEDFYRGLCRTLELELSYAEFQRIWNGIFTETILPEAMIAGLAANYRLVLLSNTNRIHFDMLRQTYPFLRYFHQLVLSFEVGAMKPDPRIYQAALQAAGCLPGECFYTDDIKAYTDAARQLGIDAVQFESAGQLSRELSARGIRW